MASKQDPYSVLGLSSCACADDIRRAYHRLARKYHPDASGDPTTTPDFQRITDAYQALCGCGRVPRSDEAQTPWTPPRPTRQPRPGPEPFRPGRPHPFDEPLVPEPPDIEPLTGRWQPRPGHGPFGGPEPLTSRWQPRPGHGPFGGPEPLTGRWQPRDAFFSPSREVDEFIRLLFRILR